MVNVSIDFLPYTITATRLDLHEFIVQVAPNSSENNITASGVLLLKQTVEPRIVMFMQIQDGKSYGIWPAGSAATII